jgi:hypothetical protein
VVDVKYGYQSFFFDKFEDASIQIYKDVQPLTVYISKEQIAISVSMTYVEIPQGGISQPIVFDISLTPPLLNLIINS